jgi:hypothetical protein
MGRRQLGDVERIASTTAEGSTAYKHGDDCNNAKRETEAVLVAAA